MRSSDDSQPNRPVFGWLYARRQPGLRRCVYAKNRINLNRSTVCRHLWCTHSACCCLHCKVGIWNWNSVTTQSLKHSLYHVHFTCCLVSPENFRIQWKMRSPTECLHVPRRVCLYVLSWFLSVRGKSRLHLMQMFLHQGNIHRILKTNSENHV